MWEWKYLSAQTRTEKCQWKLVSEENKLKFENTKEMFIVNRRHCLIKKKERLIRK